MIFPATSYLSVVSTCIGLPSNHAATRAVMTCIECDRVRSAQGPVVSDMVRSRPTRISMAIAPRCDVVTCGRELEEFGALLLSPPDNQGFVKKYHLCVD